MTRTPRGFTLIEVLVVCAMLGILMAIAAPALLRARLSGNEASAIGSMRAIASAQSMYSSTCAADFFAPSLTALGAPPPVGVSFIGPELGAADTIVKSGFTITMASSGGPSPTSPASCNGLAAGASTSGFFSTATASVGTGTRSFGVNTRGAIYQADQMTPLMMTDTTSPAGARPVGQ